MENPTPLLTVIDGHPVVLSLAVADHFERNHKDILRRIVNLLSDLPEEVRRRNFAPSSYLNAQGKEQPAFNLTRDGFVLTVMGMTGRKALLWKIRYIQAFNAMEAELASRKSGDSEESDYLRRLARISADTRAGLLRLAQRIEGRGAARETVLACYRVLVEEVTADMPDAATVMLPGDAPWAGDIEAFLAERCAVSPGLKVQAGKLYAAFEVWARDKGLANLPSSIAFGRTLRRRFPQSKANVYWWAGLALTETIHKAAPAAGKGVMQ